MEMTGGFLGVDRELGPIGSTLLRAATAGDSCLPSDSSALATRSIWDSSPDRSEVSQYAIRQPQTPLSSCRIDLYSGSRTSAADLDICNEVAAPALWAVQPPALRLAACVLLGPRKGCAARAVRNPQMAASTAAQRPRMDATMLRTDWLKLPSWSCLPLSTTCEYMQSTLQVQLAFQVAA